MSDPILRVSEPIEVAALGDDRRGVAFDHETITAEIRRRRAAGEFTLATATNSELLQLDAMISLRKILGGLEEIPEALGGLMSSGGLGALAKIALGR